MKRKNFCCANCKYYWFEDTADNIKSCLNCGEPVTEDKSNTAEKKIKAMLDLFDKPAQPLN